MFRPACSLLRTNSRICFPNWEILKWRSVSLMILWIPISPPPGWGSFCFLPTVHRADCVLCLVTPYRMMGLLVGTIQTPLKNVKQASRGSLWLLCILGQWNFSAKSFLGRFFASHSRHLKIKPTSDDVDMTQHVFRGSSDGRLVLPSSSGLPHLVVFRATVRHHCCLFRGLSQITQINTGGRWGWPFLRIITLKNINKCHVFHVVEPISLFMCPGARLPFREPVKFPLFSFSPLLVFSFGLRGGRSHCSSCLWRRHQTLPFSTWKCFKPFFTTYA